MILNRFIKQGLIHPPDWLEDNTHLIVNAGSHSYGIENEHSDYDLFGFCTPKKAVLFPHISGVIKGFGDQGENFERWSESHVIDPNDGREYDFSILNITHFFNLCLKNNPDQMDVLFVNRENIRHITQLGEIVRENRYKFLSKQVYFRYKNYAYSQFNKAEREKPTGKRKELRDKYGWDPKFLCHTYRLVFECQQILEEGDLDLMRNREHLKAVKNGGVTLEDARKWFAEKERTLEKAYNESKLPVNPNEHEIKEILLKCLEHHYGSLKDCIRVVGREENLLKQIKEMVKDY